MRTCPDCNYSGIPQNSKYCTNCGHEFRRSGGAVVYFLIGAFIVAMLGAINQSQKTRPINTPTLKPVSSYIKPTSTATKKLILTKTNVSSSSTPTTARVSQPLPKPSATKSTCPGAPGNRVAISDLVEVVTTNDDRLVLRSKPEISSSTLITRLNRGTQLKIHDGPICVKDPDTGINYWFWEVKVKTTNKMGWVAEGDKSLYYIMTKR